MINISAFGITLSVIASNTFPNGFPVTAFADDADAVDAPDHEVSDTGMGPNGDMVIWNRAVPLEVGYNLIPSSPEDVNSNILLEANRAGKGKSSARDIITLVMTYPSGQVVTLNPGGVITGTLLQPVLAAGRLKSHLYRYRFENMVQSGQGA
jgi:hypothetical protein